MSKIVSGFLAATKQQKCKVQSELTCKAKQARLWKSVPQTAYFGVKVCSIFSETVRLTLKVSYLKKVA